MNFEELFEECRDNEKYLAPDDFVKCSVDKLVTNIEAEFTGAEILCAELDREKEKAELNEKIKNAESRLKKIKNPSNLQKMNATQREELSKKITEKRNKIRKEIALYELRLSEIEIEENKKSEEEDEKKRKIKKSERSGANIGFSNGKSGGRNKLPKIRSTSDQSHGTSTKKKDENSDNIFKQTWQNTNPYADI
jgi:hypothetical protein